MIGEPVADAPLAMGLMAGGAADATGSASANAPTTKIK